MMAQLSFRWDVLFKLTTTGIVPDFHAERTATLNSVSLRLPFRRISDCALPSAGLEGTDTGKAAYTRPNATAVLSFLTLPSIAPSSARA